MSRLNITSYSPILDCPTEKKRSPRNYIKYSKNNGSQSTIHSTYELDISMHVGRVSQKNADMATLIMLQVSGMVVTLQQLLLFVN